MDRLRVSATKVALDDIPPTGEIDYQVSVSTPHLSQDLINFLSLLPGKRLLMNESTLISDSYHPVKYFIIGSLGSWFEEYGLYPVQVEFLSSNGLLEPRFKSQLPLDPEHLKKLKLQGQLVTSGSKTQISFVPMEEVPAVPIIDTLKFLGYEDLLISPILGDLQIQDTSLIYSPSDSHTLDLEVQFTTKLIDLIPNQLSISKSTLTLHDNRLCRNSRDLVERFKCFFKDVVLDLRFNNITTHFNPEIKYINHGTILEIKFGSINSLDLELLLAEFGQEPNPLKEIDPSIVLQPENGATLNFDSIDMKLINADLRIQMRNIILDITFDPKHGFLRGENPDLNTRVESLLRTEGCPSVISQNQYHHATVYADKEDYNVNIKYDSMHLNVCLLLEDVTLSFEQNKLLENSLGLSGTLQVTKESDLLSIEIEAEIRTHITPWQLHINLEDLELHHFLLFFPEKAQQSIGSVLTEPITIESLQITVDMNTGNYIDLRGHLIGTENKRIAFELQNRSEQAVLVFQSENEDQPVNKWISKVNFVVEEEVGLGILDLGKEPPLVRG